MVMNITNEEFIVVTLAIGDNYNGDDIRCNDVVAGHGSGATWWPNFQLMQVSPPGG